MESKTMQSKIASVNTKFLSSKNIQPLNDKGEISGYASVFNVIDGHNDVAVKGAFAKSIENFFKSGKKPKLLWQHDTNLPIGIIEEIYEDDYGLFIKSRLILEIPKARETYLLLKSKAIDGFSIGYQVKDSYFDNNIQYLTDIDLLEVSVVTFPACKNAVVEKIKSNEQEQTKKEKTMNNNTASLPLSNNMNEGTYKKSDFSEYIRKGAEPFLKKALSEKAEEDGGYLIPKMVTTQIYDKMKFLSPIRTIAKIMSISTNSVDILIDAKSPDAGWYAAGDEKIGETTSPQMNKIKIPVHEIFAKPMADQRLLDDSEIDAEEWLINKIAEKFATLEDEAFINGDGKDKPKGFLRHESEESEKRGFGKLQHFCSGANGAFAYHETAVNILTDMACSLKPNFVKNAKWIMSRSALAEIRKLKNKDGASLWSPSLSESTPAILLGYPVVIDDNMPVLKVGTESISVAFGDFSSGYQIVDRQGFKILRDPYTSKPFVEFYATKRVGGDVVDFDAIKLLKFKPKNA